jgi:hypothetical protein
VGYKSETLQNRFSASVKYNKNVFSFITLLNPNLQGFKND